jgi:hypothetical protein
MSDIPNDDKVHCFACYRFIRPGQTYHLTIEQKARQRHCQPEPAPTADACCLGVSSPPAAISYSDRLLGPLRNLNPNTDC